MGYPPSVRPFGYFITKADDPEQTETDFPLLSETLDNQAKSRLKALAVFNFRSFLNLGMLLTESEKAKALRSAILDIVIDTLIIRQVDAVLPEVVLDVLYQVANVF